MTTDKVEIYLTNDYHPCLVIEKPTGVVYRAQAGGTLCAQPAAEGFIVFLNYFELEEELTRTLESFFMTTSEWANRKNERFFDALDASLAEAMDGYVKMIDLKLDRTRGPDEEWGEAWVPITCKYGRGWLTWPNSD